MFLEERPLKIIGIYKVFYISMHSTNTNVDTYNEFRRKNIMLTRKTIVEQKKLFKTNDF